MTFLRSFWFRLVSESVIYLTAMGNAVLISRVLGPEGRGYYTILATTVAILSLLLGEGIRRSNTYLTGRVRDRTPYLFANTLYYSLVLGIILPIVFLLFARFIVLPDIGGGPGLLLLMVGVTTFNMLLQSLMALFLGLERMVEYNLVPVCVILLFFGGNLVALRVVGYRFWTDPITFRNMGYGLHSVMTSWLVACMVCSLVTIVLLGRVRAVGWTPGEDLWTRSMHLGFRAMLTSLLIILMFRAGVYLVKYFLGPDMTGIYSIAILFADLLQKVPNIAGTVLFSKVAPGVSKSEDQLTARVSRGIFFVTLLSALSLIAVGRLLIPLLFGEEFADAYVPLVFMLPGIVAAAAGSVVNTNLWGRGYPIVTVVAPGIGLLINIVFNVLLIPRLGLIGAGISTPIAYILWTALIFRHFIQGSSCTLGDLLWIRIADFPRRTPTLNPGHP